MSDAFQLLVLSVCIILVFALVVVNRGPAFSIPKIVWLYWDEVARPPLIEVIHTYNMGKMEGWDVRFLNKETIHTYVDAEEYPAGLAEQKIQHQSDWYRLYLLSKYGGCWMDASIILNDPDALDDIWERSIERRADITIFGTSSFNEEEGTKYKTFTHAQGLDIPLAIDNWFIMAPLHSTIAAKWFEEFNTALKMGLLAYKRECIKEGVDISIIYFADEDDTYLTMHICIQKIVQKDLEEMPSILILKSCDSMFKLHEECEWKQECIEEAILKEESRDLPYIKLMSSNRTDKLLAYFQ
jgi:hypothetical protein